MLELNRDCATQALDERTISGTNCALNVPKIWGPKTFEVESRVFESGKTPD